MNDQLYELTVEKNHLSIIVKALSNYICSQYDGIDAELVDIPKTMENIKIAADMQLVLKHQLGTTRHTPKQTSQTTGLIWIKEVFAPQETTEPFEPFNDVNLQSYTCEDEFSELTVEQIEYLNSRLKRSWNNVKERNKGTLQRMSNK